MAEVVISQVLQLIVDKMTLLVLAKLELGGNFRKDFERLECTPIIQVVIEDVEKKQMKDRKVKIWLTRLKEVAYDADDLLDELTTQVLRRSAKKKNKVRMSFLTLKPFTSYFVMSSKLKQIREKLDDTTKEMCNFQFNKVVVYERSETAERRETGPYVDETEVYGRQDDTGKVVELLLEANTNNATNVATISIVGIGGIGKTTVAQLTYNDQRVTMHFDLKMWVSVFDNCNVRKVLTEMLDYANKQNSRPLVPK